MVYMMVIVGVVFMILYFVKVLYLIFLVNFNGISVYYSFVVDNLFINFKSYKFVYEGDFFLILFLVMLVLFFMFFGFIIKDMFMGMGFNLFVDNSLFIYFMYEMMMDIEFVVFVLFKLLFFMFIMFFIVMVLSLLELLLELVIYFKLFSFGYNIFGFFN